MKQNLSINDHRDFIVRGIVGIYDDEFGDGESLELHYENTFKVEYYVNGKNNLAKFLEENGAWVRKLRFTNVNTGETREDEYVEGLVRCYGVFPFECGDYGDVHLFIAKSDDCWYKTILDTDVGVVINEHIYEKEFVEPSSDSPYLLRGTKADGSEVVIEVAFIG